MSKLSQTRQADDQSYWAVVRRQFMKNRMAVWSLRFVYVIIVVGVLADFLANDLPIACGYKGKTYLPVLNSYGVSLGISKWPPELANVDWHQLSYDWALLPPVPYSPQYMDNNNSGFKAPFGKEQVVPSFRFTHFLGTDKLGRDVLSGMIHGTRVAMLVGIISMSIAMVIGILLGSMAGYFGDARMKMSRIRLWLNIVFFFLAIYYAFIVRSYTLSDALSVSVGGFLLQLLISLLIFTAIMALANLLVIPLKRIPFLRTQVNIPMDILISRLIEVKVSVPTLLLILSICAIMSKPSIFITMIVIGFLGWTGIAKYVRAELLRVRSLEYIEAAQALGLSEWRIILRHAIPNSLTSVLITVAFGVAGAILTESTLSFLGIGVAPEQVTWGSLLSSARSDASAWWLAVFPGMAIFITVTVFNLLGEGLTDAMDPRLKQ
ncbi:MAG: ABC transporter permease [Chitinophagales bacterium]|nr:ABC transporter permease [Chitinophagales bacterium]MDW8418005.1 ABC transporter permease [Chitinophagales bacterium]